MSADDSMSPWIQKLSHGDSRAAQVIWDRYFERLAFYARKKLERLPTRAADEEDVAISAMHSFCRGVAAGRFPQLAGHHELWPLLVTITARKIYAQARRDRATKRGGGKVRGESVFLQAGGDDQDIGIEQVLGNEPTPELANMVAEECQRLLEVLGDESLRQVALLKLEGYTSDEIAKQLDCVTRTVERKLERIRAIWSQPAAA